MTLIEILDNILAAIKRFIGGGSTSGGDWEAKYKTLEAEKNKLILELNQATERASQIRDEMSYGNMM